MARFPSVHIPLSLPLIKKQSQRESGLVFAMICLSFPPPSTSFIFSFSKREMLEFHSLFPSQSPAEASPKEETEQLGTAMGLS